MSEAATKPEEKEEKSEKSKVHYYRTLIAGLKIQTADNNDPGISDPALLEHVRFSVYEEKYQGDVRRVGFLVTEDKYIIKTLSTDGNVTELTKEQYDKAMEDPDTKPVI